LVIVTHTAGDAELSIVRDSLLPLDWEHSMSKHLHISRKLWLCTIICI